MTTSRNVLMSEEIDELERTTMAVLEGERHVAVMRRELASIDWRATPIAEHRVGRYGAVLLFLRHRDESYEGGVCGEVFLAESFVRDGVTRWSILSGGGGGWAEPEDYWRDGSFEAGHATACDVDEDLELVTWSGYAPSGHVVGLVEGEEASRIAVAEHGFFCLAGLVAPGQELRVTHEEV